MGREWYPWGGSKSSKSKPRAGHRPSTNSKKHQPPPPPTMAAAAAAATGCMTAVFQGFDLPQLHFCLQHHGQHPFEISPNHPSSSLKGVEAPRNSLETAPTSMVSISETLQVEEDGNLNIPMGIQINTSRRDTGLLRSQPPSSQKGNTTNLPSSQQQSPHTPSNGSRRDTKLLLRVRAPRAMAMEEQQRSSPFSSQSTSSPAGTRTPNLVARLMGLDLLPEDSPRSSNATPHARSTNHTPKMNGYDFMSETPKSSTAGARRSDADGYGYNNRRLSLQINKENRGANGDLMELSRHSCSEINTKRRDLTLKGAEDENVTTSSRSPSFYAKQIMKQVKETVMRRRFGADITNKAEEGQTRDVHLVFSKPKKAQHLNKAPMVQEPKEVDLAVKVPVEVVVQPVLEQDLKQSRTKSTKKASGSGIRFGNAQLNKKEEQFVRAAVATTRASQGSDKKCKNTPLSSELLHGTVVPLKKSDPSTTSRRPAQDQMSKKKFGPSTRGPNYPTQQPPNCAVVAAASTKAEFNYITQILKRAGIDRDTPLSSSSRRNPMSPSLFHRLEAEKRAGGAYELSPRCIRRLMFDLVEEILDDMMKPPKRRGSGRRWARIHRFQLTRMVWTKVKGFPRAECRILQDIDELVEGDLGSGSGFVAREEEEDDIVGEIERGIVEALVFDTAVAVGGGWDAGFPRTSLQI